MSKALQKSRQATSVALPLSTDGPDFTLRLTHIPQDCKLHQCLIAAAQAASNLDTFLSNLGSFWSTQSGILRFLWKMPAPSNDGGAREADTSTGIYSTAL
ncbi:hypothetical protein QYF61_026265 [Mycteria americana]|uniref:Uncharacterized protein n=1 Tax=Mycteria americana TaxID=33587 RepID=A0AAN7RU13_MYCAM|nr:hypothetical protein QYF61_026265 [Mycteria americana]